MLTLYAQLTIDLGRYPRDTRTPAGARLVRGLLWMPFTILLLLILAFVYSLAPEQVPASLLVG